MGIVLARTNYGEADRIITFLTPDHGKVKGFAKGVRRTKSKLAGGIELFSVSELSFIIGKSEINTVISTRLLKHYGNIVKDLGRTNLGYDFIKILNKATEEQPEEAYFNLLKQAFEALDDSGINSELINVWFNAKLLKLAGHSPNLRTRKTGEQLEAGEKYDFDFDAMAFQPGKAYNSDQIKFLRLLFSGNSPQALQKVQQADALAAQVNGLIRPMLQAHIRI